MTDTGPEDNGSDVRTFLIADVRGYTRFTQTRGDEAAGELAARFAALVDDVVTERGGRLLELRGDEALVVFVSPRQAIRCALDLQARFIEETLAQPALPFGVGIGIDSGEAVAVQDGYRGGALNTAARVCSLAGPGEVLATSEATHLARRIDGGEDADRGRVQLKGIEDPPPVMRVFPTAGDPASSPVFRTAVLPPATGMSAAARRQQRQRLVAIGAALVLIIGVGVVYVGTQNGNHGLPEIGSNAVGAVSINGNKLHRRVAVGTGPGAIAADDKAVWVANTADQTVTRVDLADKNAPGNTIPVGSGPSGIAIGGGAVWVTQEN